MYTSLERHRERRRTGEESGYSMFELLVVILILAILAATVVFAIDAMTGSTSKVSCESDVQTVDHAVLSYRVQMTTSPDSISSLENAQRDPAGSPAGPWLHNTPTNGKHYEVILADGNTAYRGWDTSPASNAPIGTIILESWNTATNDWNAAPDGYVYTPPLVAAGVTVNADGPFTTAQDACSAFGAS